MRGSAGAAGFTLIEAMAVAVILAMGAAVVAASLGSRGGGEGAMRDVISVVSACDRWARAEALGKSPVVLEVDGRGVSVRAPEGGDVVLRAELPPRVLARILVHGSEAESIRIDVSGRSADYEVEYGVEDAIRRARVSGVTGWVALDSEEHE